ncbi:MAG: 50S ribosomal protein L32 [Kiritimatiellia bacterium]|nr:50S ribosomal protein L32 [Kiritimatiellia bacterium]
MAVPKRKKSRSKNRMQARSHKRALPGSRICPQCKATAEPHRVCRACGYYAGRQVLTVNADAD